MPAVLGHGHMPVKRMKEGGAASMTGHDLRGLSAMHARGQERTALASVLTPH
jgi:cytochrome c5